MNFSRRLFYIVCFVMLTSSADAHLDSVKVYLPFYGSLNDWSGWNNPATSPYESFTHDRNGQPNRALLLTGANSHIDVPTKSILNEKYSYLQWLRIDEKPDSAGVVVFQMGDSGIFQTFSIFPGLGDSVILDYTFGKTGEDSGLRASVYMPLQSWNHIALMRSADSVYWFYNAQLLAEKPISGNRDTKGYALRYGKDLQAKRAVKGVIDEIRVFSENIEPDLLYTLYYGEKVNVNTASKGDFIMYPNPAGRKIRVESDLPIRCIEIYDARGAIVLSKVLFGQRQKDLELSLEPGVYLVRIHHEGARVSTERLVISAVPE